VPPYVIYCWGSNVSGQIGIGSLAQSDVSSPTRVIEP
jgi:alpha-tubulin suppressor-like RCC1 family protein